VGVPQLALISAVTDRWDAVELWVTQLPFPVQVLLAVLVVLPLCGGVAVFVDRGVERLVTAGSARRGGPSGR
jgi:hypothetical protein